MAVLITLKVDLNAATAAKHALQDRVAKMHTDLDGLAKASPEGFWPGYLADYDRLLKLFQDAWQDGPLSTEEEKAPCAASS